MKNRRIVSVIAYIVFYLAILATAVLCFLWVFRGFPSVPVAVYLTPCGLLAVVALAIAEAFKR